MYGFSRPPRLFNTWAWRLLVAQWVILLLGFTAFRLAFLALYAGLFDESSPGAILFALLHGVRYDLAVIFGVTGLPSLAFLTLSPLPPRRFLFWLLFLWCALTAMVMFTLAGVDLFYYAYVGRRVSFEAVSNLKDWKPLAALIADAYFWQALAVAVAGALTLILGVRIFSRIVARPWRRVYWWSHPLQWALLFVLVVVLTRGGWQAKPLGAGHAFRGGNLALGHLTLNPVFTTAVALWRSKQRLLAFMPEEQALGITRDTLGLIGPPQRPGFPLWGKTMQGAAPVSPASSTPRNVVFIVLESYSAQFIGALRDPRGLTPHFDALALEGWLFRNFHASGTRSLEGIASILTGFPALPTGTLIGSTFEQNAVPSLPLLLKKRGYASFFLHGAFKGSMYFDAFAGRHGFDRYIAKEDFPDAERISDSYWGIFDHYALDRLHEELSAAQARNTPVLGFFFSLSSHTPFELPGPEWAAFPPDTPDAPLLNSVAYTDKALGRFFDKARASDYWKRTIFVITADHNMGGSQLDPRARMWIPLLILNPGDPAFPSRRVSGVLGSQIDLAPTVVDLLGVPAEQAFIGRSLLTRPGAPPTPPRFALFGWGNQAGWLRDDSLLIHGQERPLAFHRYGPGRTPTPNLILPGNPDGRGPEGYGRSLEEVRGVLQTLNNLLVLNRLVPPPGK